MSRCGTPGGVRTGSGDRLPGDATSVEGPPDAPRPTGPREGQLVAGKYRLLHRIADGAMGAVWRGSHTRLDLPVAIKVVHPHVKYPFVVPTLLWEAQAASKISHPAIVKIFDYGETAEGETFIVMEHLVGETLRSVLERDHRVDPERAVRVLLPIADGLQAAHERGIVHRDLKPENIVLARDGSGRILPKLIDFGIAKLSWVGDAWDHGASVVGTPGYMPLEQLSGETVDARADVWALSAVLYELVTGVLPFDSPDVTASLRALQSDRLLALTEHLEPDASLAALSAVVERGLRRHVADRWASARELHDALADWLPPSRRTPVSARFPRRAPSGACLNAPLRASHARYSDPSSGTGFGD